jgi:hypothetical protein
MSSVFTKLDARFGINVGGRRSRCWRIRSGARKPEVFIEREGLEKVLHFTFTSRASGT